MSQVRTYVDANVLILVATTPAPFASPAFDIINDPDRQFVASAYLQLEVMPKALFHGWEGELTTYRNYFDSVVAWAKIDVVTVELALEIAQTELVRALDALHLACAIQLGADEFVTAESPKSRLARTSRIRVLTI